MLKLASKKVCTRNPAPRPQKNRPLSFLGTRNQANKQPFGGAGRCLMWTRSVVMQYASHTNMFPAKTKTNHTNLEIAYSNTCQTGTKGPPHSVRPPLQTTKQKSSPQTRNPRSKIPKFPKFKQKEIPQTPPRTQLTSTPLEKKTLHQRRLSRFVFTSRKASNAWLRYLLAAWVGRTTANG